MTNYSHFCYYYPQCNKKYIKDCTCTQHFWENILHIFKCRMHLLNLILIWQIYIFIQPNHQVHLENALLFSSKQSCKISSMFWPCFVLMSGALIRRNEGKMLYIISRKYLLFMLPSTLKMSYLIIKCYFT